jgi:hypothetical protein
VGVMIGRFAYSSAMICRSCGAGRVNGGLDRPERPKSCSVRPLHALFHARLLRDEEQEIDLSRPSRCSATSRKARRLVPKAGVVVTDESLVHSMRQLRQKLGDQEHRLINSRAPSAILRSR